MNSVVFSLPVTVGVDKLIEAARGGVTEGISLLFAIIAPKKPELSEIKGFC